jgi:hypothetical protein
MKSYILSAFVLLFAITACQNTNKPHTHDDSTHTHEDGSTHSNHDTSAAKQETFTVGDSTKTDTTKPHTHKDGTSHSH